MSSIVQMMLLGPTSDAPTGCEGTDGPGGTGLLSDMERAFDVRSVAHVVTDKNGKPVGSLRQRG